MLGRSPRAWLGLACLACLITRAPAFRYTVISDDEAIYDAMAQVVATGGVMYRDTVDHKPPGLVYSYAAVQRLVALARGSDGTGELPMAAVHLAGLLAVLATCLALHRVARHLLDGEAALLPPLLYALASAAKQPVDGLAVNGELLMNLPSVLAVLAALAASATESRARRIALDLAAGALVGCATLYKYQAAVLLLALPALLLGERPARAVARLIAWGVGAALPVALCLGYFARHGALDDALAWGIGFNRRYLAGGPTLGFALERALGALAAVVLPSLLVYAAGGVTLYRLLRRRRGAVADVVRGRAFLAAWGVLALVAVTAGGRFFGHYFLQPELPFALLAAPPIARLLSRAPRRIALLLAIPALGFAALAAVPFPSTARLFDIPDYGVIAAAVDARTTAADTIWVWGNAPQIYHAAHRRQGVRFAFCNYLTGLSPATPSEHDPRVDPRADAVPWAWQLALDDLASHRPQLVVDTAAAGLKSYGKFPIADFPSLSRYLAAHYRSDGDADGAVLYRRID